jgi:hypothetical protein
MTTYQSTNKLEIAETVRRAVSYGVCDIKLTNVSGDGFCYLIDMELDIFTEQETRYLAEFFTVEETALELTTHPTTLNSLAHNQPDSERITDVPT